MCNLFSISHTRPEQCEKDSSILDDAIVRGRCRPSDTPAISSTSLDTTYHDGNTRVGRTQVNTDHISSVGSRRLPSHGAKGVVRRRSESCGRRKAPSDSNLQRHGDGCGNSNNGSIKSQLFVSLNTKKRERSMIFWIGSGSSVVKYVWVCEK